MDLAWIKKSYKLYNDSVNKIQNEDIQLRFMPSIIAYTLLIINVLFVLLPHTTNILHFSISGLVIYGVYNATTYAILKDYPLKVAIIDTTWGLVSHTILGILLAV
jgi:uncharacterized membrane protein